MTAGEHFGESFEGVDGCVEFSALTGRTTIIEFEDLVVVRVDVEENAASSDGAWAAIVATGAVSGDDYCVAMRGEVVAFVTLVPIVAGLQMDQVVESRAVADVVEVTTGSHKVLSGDVAYVVMLVVAIAPVTDRIVDASDGVLHLRCWAEDCRR